MARCAGKYTLVFVAVLVGLMLFGALCACSKEEIRRTLPVERSF